MANNTSVDYIAESKVSNLRLKNICELKKKILELYRKNQQLVLSLNTLIGKDDSTPNLIDNISEAIVSTRLLDAVKNDTYTHIHHSSDGTVKEGSVTKFETKLSDAGSILRITYSALSS